MSFPVVVGNEVADGGGGSKSKRRSRRRELPSRWVEKEIEAHQFKLSRTASSSYDSCDNGDMTVISASMPIIPPPQRKNVVDKNNNNNNNTHEISKSCTTLAAVWEDGSVHHNNNNNNGRNEKSTNKIARTMSAMIRKQSKTSTLGNDDHSPVVANSSDGESRKKRNLALGMTALVVILLYVGFLFVQNQIQSTTMSPTASPSISLVPSVEPSWMPTISTKPSVYPSISIQPSTAPSVTPTLSVAPSGIPSVEPSGMPSSIPSLSPSTSLEPSLRPTLLPSFVPTSFPTTTLRPSVSPSKSLPTSAGITVQIVGDRTVSKSHTSCHSSGYLWIYSTMIVSVFFCLT